jgi:hypothetical protein|tara:strand:- start:178 stop:447 length:270 start_codon:yes stop_codon:yes gene_type:complete
MSYRWIITKDNISDGEAVGVEGMFGCDATLKSNPQRFSLWDDDDICYAEGMMYSTDKDYNYENSLFSPLWNYGSPNWGCVSIKVDGEFV